MNCSRDSVGISEINLIAEKMIIISHEINPIFIYRS